MKRQLIYPVCALLLFCISSVAPSQSGVQKAGSTKVRKNSDRPVAKNPRRMALPDLGIKWNNMQCYNHTASMMITRSGSPIPRSFVARLWVYRGTTQLEEVRQTVAPFTGSSKIASFRTQTELHNKPNDITYCVFTVDADNQIEEKFENNNGRMQGPPQNQNVPNE